jgi:hypothetical protein
MDRTTRARERVSRTPVSARGLLIVATVVVVISLLGEREHGERMRRSARPLPARSYE